MSSPVKNEYKIVLIGGGGVGKSCVTIQLVRSKFVEDYDPTIEDQYRKQMIVDGEACMLEILDTAGQEEFSAMKDQYYRSGQGFLLVYAINDTQTFNEIVQFREQIIRAKDSDKAPIVVIGNKCDLESERKVSTQEGQNISNQWKAPFFETSAKTNTNVTECFHQLVRQIRATNNSKKGSSNAQKKKKGGCIII